jgi:hypothetical protein
VQTAPVVETCPRCGTFAPLVDTGLARVCTPCVEPSLHPIRRGGNDAVKLLAGLGLVMRELGWLNLVFVAALSLPWLLVSPARPFSPLVAVGLLLVAVSAAEALAFVVWFDRTLRGHAVAWRTVGPAFARVLAANLALGLVLGVCCSPVALLYGPVSGVVALLALEGGGLVEGLRTAWRRSAGRRVALVVVYAMTLVPAVLAPVLVAGVSWVLSTQRPGLAWERLVAETTPFLVVALAVGLVPSIVFQAVAWLATLPVPEAPTLT